VAASAGGDPMTKFVPSIAKEQVERLPKHAREVVEYRHHLVIFFAPAKEFQ
jgi:hypothetical protein